MVLAQLVRSQTLYPTELRGALYAVSFHSISTSSVCVFLGDLKDVLRKVILFNSRVFTARVN
jgi:hypothetical protein